MLIGVTSTLHHYRRILVWSDTERFKYLQTNYKVYKAKLVQRSALFDEGARGYTRLLSPQSENIGNNWRKKHRNNLKRGITI